MGLFSKEKGIILNILNAIFVIWIVGAGVAFFANVSNIIFKDHVYTYDEYRAVYCNMDYDTEEDCRGNFVSYEIDQTDYQKRYKRDSIIALGNVALVFGAMYLVNKEKKNK